VPTTIKEYFSLATWLRFLLAELHCTHMKYTLKLHFSIPGNVHDHRNYREFRQGHVLLLQVTSCVTLIGLFFPYYFPFYEK
jgi:hypothetical protein